MTFQFREVVEVQAAEVFKVVAQGHGWRSVEQSIEILVPDEGPQDFLPEHNSTASSLEQIVDIPVRSRGLQGFHPRQSSSAFAAQSVDILVPRGIPHLDLGSAASLAPSRDEVFQGFFFALFTDFK